MISATLWKEIEPLLPRNGRAADRVYKRAEGGGRKRNDDRLMFTAVLEKFATGQAWRDLTGDVYGSGSAVHARFRQWEKAGLIEALEHQGLLDHPELRPLRDAVAIRRASDMQAAKKRRESAQFPLLPIASAEPLPITARGRRIRLEIIAAAQRLFHRNGGEQGGGFETTTAEAIAAEAGVSTRTFFRYFQSKMDVIYLDLSYGLRDLGMELDRRLPHDKPVEQVLIAWFTSTLAMTHSEINRDRMRRAYSSPNFLARRGLFIMESQSIIFERLSRQQPYSGHGPMCRLISGILASMLDMINEAWAQRGAVPDEEMLTDMQQAFSAIGEVDLAHVLDKALREHALTPPTPIRKFL